ncbi:hypothetical protein H1230_12480 [Paenibacillus sp. 19GGS1-52]|nr:hypothetical protein H1230_12480 [Paenibacillus sp. 19GGS1-52]
MGRFITEYTCDGRVNHLDSQNPYIYVINNPLIYVDPSGHILNTIVDAASFVYDAYEFVKDPSWSNASYVGLDVLSAAVPFVPSGSSAIRAALLKPKDVF